MIISVEVVAQQSADGLICIQLDKNDWTAEDKHLGGETDATSALITTSQIAPLRKHMEPLQMNRCNQCTYNKLLPLGNAWILQKADGSIK